jgi:hypothetical protein
MSATISADCLWEAFSHRMSMGKTPNVSGGGKVELSTVSRRRIV